MSYFIRLTGIISKEKVKELSFSGIKENEISSYAGLFCDYSEFDIPLYHKFLYLINLDTSKVIEINAAIKHIYRSPKLAYDNIPKGHKTLIFVEVNEMNLFDTMLPVVNGWEYNPDKVYLSDTSQI